MSEPPPPINDPFATYSGERSILKPRPGGWGAARNSGEPTAAQAPVAEIDRCL